MYFFLSYSLGPFPNLECLRFFFKKELSSKALISHRELSRHFGKINRKKYIKNVSFSSYFGCFLGYGVSRFFFSLNSWPLECCCCAVLNMRLYEKWKPTSLLISSSHWAISMTPLLEHSIGKPNLAKECRYPVRRMFYYCRRVTWKTCSLNDLTNKTSYWDYRSHRICIFEKYNQAITSQLGVLHYASQVWAYYWAWLNYS